MDVFDSFSLNSRAALAMGSTRSHGRQIVATLASDASAYVTGAVIAVDGGLTAK